MTYLYNIYRSQHLKGQCHKNFFKLRPRGVGLGPTDVLEPLFEFLYSPYNLLQYFKDGVHRSKMVNILVSDPDASIVGHMSAKSAKFFI